MTELNILPDFYTPQQVAEHFGWSERELRKKAREIGACRIMGNAMIFMQADIDLIMEASRPAPKLSPAVRSNVRPHAPESDVEEARRRLREIKERNKHKSEERKGSSKQP